ncbi:MAG: hypothetical protein RSC93_03725 [Erysipelotrichaceae bacterium]
MIRTKNNKVIKERWMEFFILLILSLLCFIFAYIMKQKDSITMFYVVLGIGVIVTVLTVIMLVYNIGQHRIIKEHDRELSFELKKQGGRTCPKCGAQIGLNDCVCNGCGRKLK